MDREKIEKLAAKKMGVTRSILMMERPFFGSLIARMRPTPLWDPNHPTMCTDGTDVFYNPEFVLETPEVEIVGINAHEGLHVGYRHHVRMGDRKIVKWNKATDYVINGDLLKASFSLPDWVLKDPQYDGCSSEEVYNLLPDDPEDGGGGGGGQGPGGGFDPGGMGGIISPCSSHDHQAIAREMAKWEAIARQSISVAKAANAGTIPGYLQRLVDDLEQSRVDWMSKLRNFAADSFVKDDQSWSSPNRRFVASGLYVPSRVSDKLSHIVVVNDTSGSVDDKLLSKYAAEVRAILDDGLVDKITVIYTDTKVQGVQIFERGDVVKLQPGGGGGTHFAAVMKYIADECYDARAVIFLTDLFTSDFGEDPGIPVLWSVYGDPRLYDKYSLRVPFGETLYIS